MIYKIDIQHLNYQINMTDDEIPEDINVHKQIWGRKLFMAKWKKRRMTNSDVPYVIHA